MIWYAIIFDKEMPHPHIIRAIRWGPVKSVAKPMAAFLHSDRTSALLLVFQL